MDIKYAVGITESEVTIPGIIQSQYYSKNSSPKIALISNTTHTVYMKLLATLQSFSNQLAYLSTNTIIANFTFPPQSGFSFENDSSSPVYIWRWITINAPDIVIEVDHSENKDNVLFKGFNDDHFLFNVPKHELVSSGSLSDALSSGTGQTPGSIPVVILTGSLKHIETKLKELLTTISNNPPIMSAAGEEIAKRQNRTPLEVSRVLGSVYGYKLDEPINYVQGVSISGRLRLHNLDMNYQNPNYDIAESVDFLLDDNKFNMNSKSGPNLAGMCWADELAQTTNDKKWEALVIKTAETYESNGKGKSPNPCDPDFGCEDMFFISTMLGRAYNLTRKNSYIDLVTNYLKDANTQQNNGLFWHNRITPYYWGRGNGFAAIAHTEALTYIPEKHPDRASIISSHIKHIDSLLSLQLPNGMWRQLLDLEGTYEEFSVTCMIGYSIARGIRLGWLDKKYMKYLDKIWRAVSSRIDDTAGLVDVCTGTGFQGVKSDYIYRKGEYGYDDRGGSMAIWFSTEMAKLLIEKGQ